MKQPVEPKEEDCCNSGCTPCIFDAYVMQLKLYESYLKYGTKPAILKENAMSQLEYNPFHVTKSVDICKEHKLIMFKSDLITGKEVFWSPGEHFLLKYESTEGCCTRAYTPIKTEELRENCDFAIIVKRYDNGLVSNYLCNLDVDENTLWRGPYGSYQVDSNITRIIMIAQGTGIAPFYSIIKHILDDEDNMTTLILFYCCKCIETVLLRDELYSFKSYWNFKYSIYLSESSDMDKTYKYQEPIFNERLTSEVILNLKLFAEKDQFLLCGSNEFMKYYEKLLQQRNVRNLYLF